MVTDKRGGTKRAIIHLLVAKHTFRPNDEETLVFHCRDGFAMDFVSDRDTTKNSKRRDAVVFNGVDFSSMTPANKVQDKLTEKFESQLETIGLTMKWKEGDFFIFDNLGISHHASEGTQAPSDEVGLRIMHRTAIGGGEDVIPTKKDWRKSFTPETERRRAKANKGSGEART